MLERRRKSDFPRNKNAELENWSDKIPEIIGLSQQNNSKSKKRKEKINRNNRPKTNARQSKNRIIFFSLLLLIHFITAHEITVAFARGACILEQKITDFRSVVLN